MHIVLFSEFNDWKIHFKYERKADEKKLQNNNTDYTVFFGTLGQSQETKQDTLRDLIRKVDILTKELEKEKLGGVYLNENTKANTALGRQRRKFITKRIPVFR